MNVKVITGLLFTIAITVALLSFSMKRDSSLGRVLIYKISYKILQDSWPSGIGIGKFPTVYGNYQINYFKSGNYTVKELLLADNTTFAFNDYFQFVIETGGFGLAILLLIFIIVGSTIVRVHTIHWSVPTILVVAISQLIAIGVAAFFMHIFEKLWVQGLFIISLVILIFYAYLYKLNLNLYVLVIITSIIILFTHYRRSVNNKAYYDQMLSYRAIFQAGYLLEGTAGYRSLYPFLKEDVEFLSEFAGMLSVVRFNKEAVEVLELLVTKNNANIFLQQLGDAYFKNGKLQKAEEAYKKSIYRVPNRFGTRYSLFDFYVKTKQLSKAEIAGRALLAMPVKVESAKIEQIQAQVVLFLNRIDTASKY